MRYIKRERVKKLGLSMLEMLISTLILLMLISICSQVLIWSLKVSNEEKGLAYIKNEAIKSINWIIKDLRRSSIDSLQKVGNPVLNVPIAISFLSPIGQDSLGSQPTTRITSPNWKVFVLYYLKPDQQNPKTTDTSQQYILCRKTFYDPSYTGAFNEEMSLPEQLSSIHTISLCNDTIKGETDRIIARHIYNLDLLEINEEKHHCKITIETRDKNINRGGEIKSNYTTTVILRNTLYKY